MKKTEKGNAGYLNYKRKIEIIRTLAYFGIVIAMLLLGYFQTGTKLNLLTVAIVGCLPASKALQGYYTLSLSFDRWRTSERNRVKN